MVLLALLATSGASPWQQRLSTKAKNILEEKKIRHDIVDGTHDVELQKQLLELCKPFHNYPQFFLKEGNKIRYLGDFKILEQMIVLEAIPGTASDNDEASVSTAGDANNASPSDLENEGTATEVEIKKLSPVKYFRRSIIRHYSNEFIEVPSVVQMMKKNPVEINESGKRTKTRRYQQDIGQQDCSPPDASVSPPDVASNVPDVNEHERRHNVPSPICYYRRSMVRKFSSDSTKDPGESMKENPETLESATSIKCTGPRSYRCASESILQESSSQGTLVAPELSVSVKTSSQRDSDCFSAMADDQEAIVKCRIHYFDQRKPSSQVPENANERNMQHRPSPHSSPTRQIGTLVDKGEYRSSESDMDSKETLGKPGARCVENTSAPTIKEDAVSPTLSNKANMSLLRPAMNRGHSFDEGEEHSLSPASSKTPETLYSNQKDGTLTRMTHAQRPPCMHNGHAFNESGPPRRSSQSLRPSTMRGDSFDEDTSSESTTQSHMPSNATVNSICDKNRASAVPCLGPTSGNLYGSNEETNFTEFKHQASSLRPSATRGNSFDEDEVVLTTFATKKPTKTRLCLASPTANNKKASSPGDTMVSPSEMPGSSRHTEHESIRHPLLRPSTMRGESFEDNQAPRQDELGRSTLSPSSANPCPSSFSQEKIQINGRYLAPDATFLCTTESSSGKALDALPPKTKEDSSSFAKNMDPGSVLSLGDEAGSGLIVPEHSPLQKPIARRRSKKDGFGSALKSNQVIDTSHIYNQFGSSSDEESNERSPYHSEPDLKNPKKYAITAGPDWLYGRGSTKDKGSKKDRGSKKDGFGSALLKSNQVIDIGQLDRSFYEESNKSSPSHNEPDQQNPKKYAITAGPDWLYS